MNTSPESSQRPESTMEPTNEQLFDRIAGLPDREFIVQRTDGTRETGWSVVGATANSEGKLLVTIMNQDTEDIKRGLSAEEVLAWQGETPATPEFYNLPTVETPGTEAARIAAQQFANEVNAAESARQTELSEGDIPQNQK